MSAAAATSVRRQVCRLRSLTKRMAHEVLNAPAHYTISEALRYGQIVGQQGVSALVETVIATRLGESFEHEDFWSTYLH